MKFRPHRGSLDNSMREMAQFKTAEDLRLFLNDPKAVIKPYYMTLDDRIGWPETWIVIAGDGWVHGFTDGPGTTGVTTNDEF